jgi:hypothetical protein
MAQKDPGSSLLELEIWGAAEVATGVRRYHDGAALLAQPPLRGPRYRSWRCKVSRHAFPYSWRVVISLPSIEQSYPQRYYVSCPALDLDLVKGFHSSEELLNKLQT